MAHGTVGQTPNMMKPMEEIVPALMGLGSGRQLGKMYATPYLFSNTSVDVPPNIYEDQQKCSCHNNCLMKVQIPHQMPAFQTDWLTTVAVVNHTKNNG